LVIVNDGAPAAPAGWAEQRDTSRSQRVRPPCLSLVICLLEKLSKSLISLSDCPVRA
jgi:hypothetical protein